MSCGSDRPARQRFKGIENFLRRVAFNLGNTPSQTEVKIISCIPIDVTDLQQKITALERELLEVREAANFNENIICEAAKNVKINPNPTRAYTSIIQTALGRATFPTPKVPTVCKCSQAKTPVASHGVNTRLEKGKSRFRRKLSSLCIVSSFSSRTKPNKVSRPRITEKEHPVATKTCCKIVPKRLRRAMRKNRAKTHMFYFTDTSRTPFNNYPTSESYVRCDNKSALSKVISRSYINSMIRKQYESELIVDDLTDISQFSAPACRDSDTETPSSQPTWHYDSFKNLDSSMKNSSRYENFNFAANKGLPIDQGPIITNYQFNNGINYSGYYDSNYYDIYPVKEKSMKHKRDESLPKQIKRLNSDDFSSEPVRIVNNLRPLVFGNDLVSKRPHKPQSYKINDSNGHEFTLTNVTKKRNRYNEYPKASLNESKLCSIEYGNVYLKRNRVIEGMEKLKPVTPTFKNAECLTLNTNHMESQTVESKGVQLNILEDNKAEVALDQIKTILQSVLAEVKTNMKFNSENKQKKSTSLQKDLSHKNVTDGSTLLNSFTYDPSCTINPCLTSYSHNVPNFCYPDFSPVPMKCFQHYPLLIRPIKHFGCNCQHKNKLPSDKYKKNTNADTEAQMTQKSETVNLIKEIYKSVPLNVYYSNKTTSRNSFAYQKNNINAEVETVNSRVISVTERSVGDSKEFEVPAPTPVSYSTNFNTDTALESMQSEILSEIMNRNDIKPSQCSMNWNESVRSANQKVSPTTISLAEEIATNVAYQVEDERAEPVEPNNERMRSIISDSETDSDATLVDEAIQKREKPGLLRKVLQTVKKLRKKKLHCQKSNPKNVIKDESLSEDSDTDSQSIYSYKTYRDLRNFSHNNPKQIKSTTQSTRDSESPVQENLKKLPPYMEQEYRRFWDETLMFNEAKPKLHSSERSFPSWTRSPHTPIYWRHFEARSAMLRDEHLKLQLEKKGERGGTKDKPVSQQKEKTGFKLEWMKKPKNKAPNK